MKHKKNPSSLFNSCYGMCDNTTLDDLWSTCPFLLLHSFLCLAIWLHDGRRAHTIGILRTQMYPSYIARASERKPRSWCSQWEVQETLKIHRSNHFPPAGRLQLLLNCLGDNYQAVKSPISEALGQLVNCTTVMKYTIPTTWTSTNCVYYLLVGLCLLINFLYQPIWLTSRVCRSVFLMHIFTLRQLQVSLPMVTSNRQSSALTATRKQYAVILRTLMQ